MFKSLNLVRSQAAADSALLFCILYIIGGLAGCLIISCLKSVLQIAIKFVQCKSSFTTFSNFSLHIFIYILKYHTLFSEVMSAVLLQLCSISSSYIITLEHGFWKQCAVTAVYVYGAFTILLHHFYRNCLTSCVPKMMLQVIIPVLFVWLNRYPAFTLSWQLGKLLSIIRKNGGNVLHAVRKMKRVSTE